MKYNINLVTDYLKELTGCRIRILAHTKNDDDKFPLGDCYQLL